MTTLNETQRATLVAVCDTVVPPVDQQPDPDGFFARRASDTQIPQVFEAIIATMSPERGAGLAQLLDALAAQSFATASLRSREQLLRNLTYLGPQAAAGVNALASVTLFLYYGMPDERGHNPSWQTFGYPGPAAPPPSAPRSIEPYVPDEENVVLEADVCIVGSGAGGGVMAGRLAESGLKVIVLEQGGHFEEPDFTQLEIPAYQNLYWRGGPTPTADMNISLQAGSCLGGGTVVNWTNSLRTTPWVREQWEREFGLEGVAGSDYDRHLDAVWQRLSVTRDCSELNGPQKRMQQGAEVLGWRFTLADRNTDRELYRYETAGYIGFGDQSGAKQSTLKTYLRDAYERGATLVARCRAERVLTENGRAAGVQALYADPVTGRSASVTVRATQVVVAAGALESPALLLRSGLGGPATGDYLRLHPCTAVFGYYPEDLRSWEGAPHAGLVHEFENVEAGYGFLIEGAQYTTAVAASAVPFTDGRTHKTMMARFRHGASFIGLLRDRGHGRITIDHEGQSVPTYSITDELDVRNSQRAIEAQVRLHQAAGAQQILPVAAGVMPWHWGEDVEPFIERLKRIPLRAGGWRLFSAHQMGTCRMGNDPQTSVAGPYGELHDAKGVWIGDGSAFPTASGTNPMISIMALAHRNAEAVAAAAPSTAGAVATH